MGRPPRWVRPRPLRPRLRPTPSNIARKCVRARRCRIPRVPSTLPRRRNSMKRRILALCAVVVLATPALAYIEALKSLAGLYKETDVIARGVIDAVSVEKKVMIVKVGKPLKGKTAYERIKINLGAADGWQGDAAVRHAIVGAPVALFYHKAENSDKAGLGMVYVNR